ncbi:MAG: hypothetical protein M3Z25_14575 [Actinomycetota bacterium]|nr:hypothetical protein [Actinomycetota bacterium]
MAPTGYRVSARRRFELVMAQGFTGTESLQAVIDLAVTEFLDRCRAEPGFLDALTSAERAQQRRTHVRPLAGP